MQQQQQRRQNSSSPPRRRPLRSDESSSTTTYTASTSTRNNSGSGTRTKPYVGSNDSSSYSYSYSSSQDATGAEKTSSAPRDNREKAGGASQLLSMLQQQQQQQQHLLPPRVPRLSLGDVPSEVAYVGPPKEIKDVVTKFASASSGSYSGSGSYSYAEEDEATEEEDTGSSYSYSYSYSDESTDTARNTAPPYKTDKGRREKVTALSASSYSEGDSATSGNNHSAGSTPGPYSKTKGDRDGSGSYTGSSSVSAGSDSYSYSTEGRTGSTPTLRTRSSTFTADSSSASVKGNTSSITRSTGGDSYSYSYSYSGKDPTSSASHRYSSTSGTPSDDSEMHLSASDTRTKSASSSSRTLSFYTRVSPQHSDVKGTKVLATSTETTSPSTTTTSLIREEKSSWRSYSDETSRDDSSTGQTMSTERSSRTSTAVGVTEFVHVRELITLCAPPEEAPRIRALPHTCLVPCGSVNDTLSQFVDRLSYVQHDVLRKAAEEKVAAAGEGEGGTAKTQSKKKKKSANVKTALGKEAIQEEEKKRSTMISTEVPSGYFIKRSVKFALKTIGVEKTTERYLLLKGLTLPLQRNVLLTLLNNQAQQCLLRRVRSMFCAHDRFLSGEVSLSVTLDILRQCGIAQRDVGDFTLRLQLLSPKARFPLVRISQRGVLTNANTTTPIATTNGENALPPESRIGEVVVDVCESAMSARSVEVYFDDSKCDLYVGNRPVARMRGASRDATRNFLQQLEAMIHVCLAVEACTVNDPTSLCSVLYNPLLTALLSPLPGAVPNGKSVILENALAAVLKPMEQLERLATHHRIQERYLVDGQDAILRDTLPHRQEDMAVLVMQQQQYQQPQEEICARHGIIDWLPKIAAGGDRFEPMTALTVNDVHYDVGLSKLRIAEAVSADAHCYCLVSARKSSSGEWMRAVTVPVVDVKPSKKGGFKWTFGKSGNDRIFFAGSKMDTLYIEACYDLRNGVATDGVISGGEMMTWCAGHAMIVCSTAKSGTFSVTHGSLMPENDNNTVTEGKLVESSKGPFCCTHRKQNAAAARSLTIVIRPLRANSLAPRGGLPCHCLALRRHVPLMARLRDAIVNADYSYDRNNKNSKSNSNTGASHPSPLHVLRQQQVQCCFTVAAHTMLMDVLSTLWERALRGKMGAKPKSTEQQYKTLFTLASKVVAVHNSIGEEQDAIMNIVTRGAAILGPLNPLAPQRPIYV